MIIETIEMEFVKETCCACNCVFMLPRQLQINLRETKAAFYCYNGHSQSYRKSTAEIAQEKLKALEIENNAKASKIQYLQNALAEVTKPKRRAKRKEPNEKI